MTDPVLVAQTGHTYERAAVEQRLRGRPTDPMSASQPIPPSNLAHCLLQRSLALSTRLRLFPSQRTGQGCSLHPDEQGLLVAGCVGDADRPLQVSNMGRHGSATAHPAAVAL